MKVLDLSADTAKNRKPALLSIFAVSYAFVDRSDTGEWIKRAEKSIYFNL